MSLVQYSIFVKIAETKSFTLAADQLGLTQSAVSHSIASLENSFGFPLIHRNRTGVILTHDGERMLPIIERVLRENEKVGQEAADIAGLVRGIIHVGVFTSVSRHWLPQIIRQMDRSYPGIEIKLQEGNYQFIEQGIISGRLDCGFLNTFTSQSSEVIPLKKDRLFCIVSSESSLYDEKFASFSHINREPFIMPAFGGNHEIKQFLKKYRIHPPIRFELMEENAILAMVANHLGISILPELILPDDLAPLRALPLEQDCYRMLGLALRPPASPATKKFAEITKQIVGQSAKIDL
ncbi:LysR family transcriptional regulator [Sporolactobacillus spathodeae]|uniref:DNA-binding transcriptional LysR family regulator n=1 Tax=Sporolactobacillus spathodeae TaxID=1465502 RepID=A0ABS2Q8A4_9BACL|nr:LysR family transcriptional regulator [Sporolactobacillus spathodeae]MBM7657886.1 DNA-binding transcriptional LysR family regulator [Sporolactobacillus spathodeae]